ncbi:GNAT family N-acetyltransferase [Anaerovibrio sp.]|uniref:GNAT family N-acetyltransferase n=1 Tax=Anaerovibrio sp. TaxID=1872532 RepID=UPI003F180660
MNINKIPRTKKGFDTMTYLNKKRTAHLNTGTHSPSFAIHKVTENKKQYLSLLLLADEQESMVDRYLEKGTMYVLDENGIKAECVVTDEGNGILEIKNIATTPEYQGKGYAKKIIEYLVAKYEGTYDILQVGTGDSPLTIPFYEKCGFVRHHIIKNFFTDNYDHPIFECGIQLVDMIYLQRKL